MTRRRVRQGLLGFVAAGLIAIPGLGITDDEARRESMRNALETLEPLLIGLIDGDFEAALQNVEPILQHAALVTKEVPDSAKDRGDEYLTWASYLKLNADILKSTLEMLARRKQGDAAVPEFLSVVAAQHHGGIVNTCVACHTHFRFPLER